MKYVPVGFKVVQDYAFRKSKVDKYLAEHECRELFIREAYRSYANKKKMTNKIYLLMTPNFTYSIKKNVFNMNNDKTKLAFYSLPIAYIKSATPIDNVELSIYDDVVALKLPATFFYRHWAIISIITGLSRLAYRIAHPLSESSFQKVFRFLSLKDVEDAVKNNRKDVLRFVFRHVIRRMEECEIPQDLMRDKNVKEFILNTLDNGNLFSEIEKTDWSEIRNGLSFVGIKRYLELRKKRMEDGVENDSNS